MTEIGSIGARGWGAVPKFQTESQDYSRDNAADVLNANCSSSTAMRWRWTTSFREHWAEQLPTTTGSYYIAIATIQNRPAKLAERDTDDKR